MDNKYVELFEVLGITETYWPDYVNLYDYSRQVERCALTINVPTTASDSSQSQIRPPSISYK